MVFLLFTNLKTAIITVNVTSVLAYNLAVYSEFRDLQGIIINAIMILICPLHLVQ